MAALLVRQHGLARQLLTTIAGWRHQSRLVAGRDRGTAGLIRLPLASLLPKVGAGEGQQDRDGHPSQDLVHRVGDRSEIADEHQSKGDKRKPLPNVRVPAEHSEAEPSRQCRSDSFQTDPLPRSRQWVSLKAGCLKAAEPPPEEGSSVLIHWLRRSTRRTMNSSTKAAGSIAPSFREPSQSDRSPFGRGPRSIEGSLRPSTTFKEVRSGAYFRSFN